MNNKKATKRALLTSIMALVMCVVMLVGTTFAWFTDTASTGVNKIVAGNLDVKLMYSTDMVEWKEATDQTKLFSDNALWEPGHTEVVYLKIVNNGSLALKYETELARNYNVSRGKSVLGNYFYVGDYLKIGTADTNTAFASREAAWAAISDSEKALKKGVQLTEGWTELEAGKSTSPFAVVIYMPTSVGNEANAKSKTWTSKITGIGLEVHATQATVENDSFGDTYDENAATTLGRISTSSDRNVTGNIQASGKDGTIEVRGGTTTINANVYSEYAEFQVQKSDGTWVDWHEAVAVWAEGNAKIIINGGSFAQTGVPADHDDHFDLIYAEGNAEIVINGGTFKSVTPQWTLNCKDGSNAKITVKGGTFYQFDPSNANTGTGEIVVPTGYHVEQNGDWYTVVAE